MNDITIISYSSSKDNRLLSLTDSRSMYMLPLAGRYRVVDFTIRNSIFSKARKTVIYNNYEDDLEDYVENYGPFKDMKFPPIKVVSNEYSDISFCYNLILDCNTAYYIIYNGDNPSIIDFPKIVKNYKKKRSAAVLYKMKVSDKSTRAHTILVTNQKILLNVINLAIDQNRTSPNIFEMIINLMINRGINIESLEAYYWPIKNIPDYYFINMEFLKNPELSDLLFDDSLLKGYIKVDGLSRIGSDAKIYYSNISDRCQIFGTVINSIIFPGVEIGEKTIVKDSIILPFVRIGSGVRILRSVIDESTIKTAENLDLNVGNKCHIGIDDKQIKNNDFPNSLSRSITLIGKNCNIPDEVRIGGACYIASEKGNEYFSKNRHLYNGLSLIR